MARLKAAVQELLVAMLLFDGTPAAAALRGLVTPKSFDPYFKDIVEEAESFRERYKKPPGEHSFDLIESIKERKPDEAEIYDRLYTSLLSVKDGVNTAYALDKAGEFVREQRMKAKLQRVAEIMRKGGRGALEEAEGIAASIGKESAAISSPGLLFNDPAQALQFLDNADNDIFPTGIKELDALGLGPARGQLWMCIAKTGGGKSTFAVHKGKHALMRGKRVLHVTLEMSEAKVAQRYCHSFFAISKRKIPALALKHFKKDDLGRFVDISEKVLEKARAHLKQGNIRKVLGRKLAPLARKPKLYIKQFPSGTLTIRQLRGYLDYLEGVHGFLPDEMLLDYPDLMEHDSKNKRLDLDKIYVDLRGIAQERNIAVAVYSQSNDLGNVKIVGLDNAAEAKSKNHTADIVITFNQTEAEKALGLARLFVAKAREEESHLQVLLSQSYGIGQFAIDSCTMPGNKYWDFMDAAGADKDSDEEE